MSYLDLLNLLNFRLVGMFSKFSKSRYDTFSRILRMTGDIQRELDDIRKGIDDVDNGIVKLLAQRRELALRLAKVKKALDVPIYDRAREQALVERVKKWGAAHKLNEEFVEVVFRLIVMNSKEVQYHESA